jgi:hypothetical protein
MKRYYIFYRKSFKRYVSKLKKKLGRQTYVLDYSRRDNASLLKITKSPEKLSLNDTVSINYSKISTSEHFSKVNASNYEQSPVWRSDFYWKRLSL